MADAVKVKKVCIMYKLQKICSRNRKCCEMSGLMISAVLPAFLAARGVEGVR